MVTTLYLLGCVMATGQAAPSGEWALETRLARSQELVYRGTFAETATGPAVQFDRAYRIETRVFVLDTQTPRGAEAAVLTVLRPRDGKATPGPTPPGESSAAAVRLEKVGIDARGKLTADPGVSLAVPLDGVPALECGAFVELPPGRVGVNHTWETAEVNRPARLWRVVGSELANGVSCVKLLGVQQSEEWDRPRADRAAWRRTDTVWLAPRLGYAYRVERVIERKEPGRQEPSQKSVLRYELESSLQYPGGHADDRRQEITQALAFRDGAAPFLPNPAKYNAQLTALLGKIDHFLEHETATPYREAVLQMRRRVEAGKRGELPPAAAADEGATAAVAATGQLAPDFLAADFGTFKTVRLRSWAGKPVLLVFYNPSSSITPDLLRYAQRLGGAYPDGVTILGMALTNDADAVRKQREELKLTLPVLNGNGLRISYEVETTPKLVLLDGEQTVRGAWLGWGPDTPREVFDELKQWLRKK